MTRAVVLALLAAACSKSSRHPPAAPLTRAAPDAAVPTPPLTTPERLSVFEPRQGHCQWLSVDARGAQPLSDVIVDFPGDCTAARVAFAPDHQHAVVWFLPSGDQETARIWRVDVAHRQATAVANPADGELEDLGFEPGGSALALTEDNGPKPQHDATGSFLTYQGKIFRGPQGADGIPVMVHAYRLDAHGWQLIESAASASGADYSPGVSELPQSATLCARSTELLTPHPDADTVAPGPELARLRKFAPDLVKEGEWQRLHTPLGLPALYVWEFEAEFLWASGRIAVTRPDGTLAAPPGLDYPPDQAIATQLESPFLLTAQSDEGERPHLYDLTTLRLVWSSETAHAVTFWPRTVCPAS